MNIEDLPVHRAITTFFDGWEWDVFLINEILQMLGLTQNQWNELMFQYPNLKPPSEKKKKYIFFLNFFRETKVYGMPHHHPLVQAVREQMVCIAKTELKRFGGDKPSYGIIQSALMGDLEKIKFHIETMKVDVNTTHVNGKGWQGCTPLHIASRMGDLDIVKYLVSKGADMTIRNRYKNNCLHYATFRCGGPHKEVLEYLISAGADPYFIGDRCTIFRRLEKKGHLDLIQHLKKFHEKIKDEKLNDEKKYNELKLPFTILGINLF